MSNLPGYSQDEADEIEQRLQLSLASRSAAAQPEMRVLLDRYGRSAQAIQEHMEEFHHVMWRHHLESYHMVWRCRCQACSSGRSSMPGFEVAAAIVNKAIRARRS